MKHSFLLFPLLVLSVSCIAQRKDPAFKSSRIVKSLYGSYGNDNVGYFWGQIFLDSSSIILKSHIGKITVKSINEDTRDSAVNYMDDDSGHFTIGYMPGIYDYTITKPGYQSLIINGFHSSENQELFIKAVLEPGSNSSIYNITEKGIVQKYVPSKPSRVANFYYGEYGDTAVAMLWGQVFLNSISPAGDSSITFGKVKLKYRCVETHDTGFAQTDDASKFAIYFKGGHYDITISSPGYQSVFLKNYYAFEDQASYLDVVLEQGNDESMFTITKDGQISKE